MRMTKTGTAMMFGFWVPNVAMTSADLSATLKSLLHVVQSSSTVCLVPSDVSVGAYMDLGQVAR